MKYLNLTDVELKNIETFSSKKSIDVYAKKTELFPQEEKTVRKYFTKNHGKVLDVGCGAGRTTYPLHKRGLQVVGVDISEWMIQRAKSMFPKIDFFVGNACRLKFKNEEFDYVLFSFNGIDYIFPEKKRLTALREINRVLKSGGIFVFSSHNSWYSLASHPYGYFYLLRFLVWNITHAKIFAQYKIDKTRYGDLFTYFTNPLKQKKQLKTCGFELLDIIGRFEGIMAYFEAWPYYIARKR